MFIRVEKDISMGKSNGKYDSRLNSKIIGAREGGNTTPAVGMEIEMVRLGLRNE